MIENLKEGSRGNLTSVTNIVQVIFVAFKIYTGGWISALLLNFMNNFCEEFYRRYISISKY